MTLIGLTATRLYETVLIRESVNQCDQRNLM